MLDVLLDDAAVGQGDAHAGFFLFKARRVDEVDLRPQRHEFRVATLASENCAGWAAPSTRPMAMQW